MVEVQQNNESKRPGDEAHAVANEDWDNKPLFDRNSFHTTFDTNAYLRDFYKNLDDPAMQMIIRFLPGIAVRLPKSQSLLDFGCGPTIHVAVIFRHYVNRIYFADYLVQNRNEIQRWMDGTSEFNWTKTLKTIATCEGNDWSKLEQMETDTKAKVNGILYCDCLNDPVIQASDKIYGTIGIVVTIFTLEYCCNTLEEYRGAIKRVVSLVKDGGYFIMGGIMEETWCSFGGRKFNCLYITKDFILECLQDAGLIINFDNKEQTIFHEINGMFLLACVKKAKSTE